MDATTTHQVHGGLDVSVVVISKDERGLADTLVGLRTELRAVSGEVVVVDASANRLDDIRAEHPEAGWIPFSGPAHKRVTIPEQRNLGVRSSRGRVVVFTDAGCRPEPGWLAQLTGPVLDGRQTVTVGRTLGIGSGDVYAPLPDREIDLVEAPTINLAFTRAAFDEVDGFDEEFDYGSDVDFTWRLRHAGHRLRLVPSAVVTHDWGGSRRQVRRAWRYGQARARLYLKHPGEIRAGLRRDPILFVYPAYLLALPLSVTRLGRGLPLLLLIPAWRARRSRPLMTVADHLAYGVGALTACVQRLRRPCDSVRSEAGGAW